MFSITIRTLAVLCMAAAPSFAEAAIIIIPTTSNGAFTVSDSDLLSGLIPTVTGNTLNGNEGASNDAGVLTNGQFGVANFNDNPLDTVSISNDTVLTYQFDLTAAPRGYDITQINTYSGWRDAGRDNQNYAVYYSTIGDPSTFHLLATVDAPGGGGNPSNVAVEIVDSLGDALVTHVAALQFVFGVQENGYVGYRELDVFGVASIPEPSSIVLWSVMGTACLAWQAGRRRGRGALLVPSIGEEGEV